jgi:uncharacterized protein
MSKIALFGATGRIGSRILNEALARGHSVTAIVRDTARGLAPMPALQRKPGDVLKPESVALAITGNEVVVSAYGPGIGDSHQLVTAAEALVEGVAAKQPMRLIVVNSAGSLEVSPGIQLLDTPDFPRAQKSNALAHREALAVCRESSVDWTCISPAAFIEAGERTGRYRSDTDHLIVDEKGESRISAEDFAVAVIDEVERPRFRRQRFTVAY